MRLIFLPVSFFSTRLPQYDIWKGPNFLILQDCLVWRLVSTLFFKWKKSGKKWQIANLKLEFFARFVITWAHFYVLFCLLWDSCRFFVFFVLDHDVVFAQKYKGLCKGQGTNFTSFTLGSTDPSRLLSSSEVFFVENLKSYLHWTFEVVCLNFDLIILFQRNLYITVMKLCGLLLGLVNATRLSRGAAEKPWDFNGKEKIFFEYIYEIVRTLGLRPSW